MHLDQRSFIDTEDAIVVEIILFDAAILQSDFAPQCGADAEDNATLDLGDDGVRVYDHPAIQRANNPMNTDLAILGHLHLGDLGKIGAHGKLYRDAATDTGRQGLSPAGFIGCEIEYAKHTWRFAEQGPAVFDRIFFRGSGQLVDKTSTTKILCVGPTPRQLPVVRPGGSCRT